nr:PREDICTED: nuclear protein MDM1 isoform X1 [Paralichthys olivaceus]
MRICREPGLQRRKRLVPGGLAQSCTSLLCPSDPQRPLAAPTALTHNKVPSDASRSRSAHRKDPSPKPPTPPESRAEPKSPAQPESPAGPRPPERCSANSGSPGEPGVTGKSRKLHPSQLNNQSQPSRPSSAAPDGRQPSANEVDHALRWRAGLTSAGQRSGGHRSEYHRQFSWKKPVTSASPMLTAEQVLYSSSRSVPPFKKHPVSMETEYQQSFKGVAPPTGPHLLKHLEHQRIPLFHTYMSNKKRREESQKKPRPKHNDPASQEDDITTPPPQVQRGHRILEEGGAMDGDTPQVTELRRRASLYRRRAWGTNFCRDHLNQLQSEHNALWEPTDSSTDPPTPCLTLDFGQEPDSRSTSCVEALDLASRSCHSSQRSSVVGSNAQTPPAERRTAWEEEEEKEESVDEDEGRLPTPRLKMRPVQRTHHDLTTPATGGAILVGTVKSSEESSLNKQQRCGSVVSMAAALDMPSEKSSPHRPSLGPSPDHKPASKPIRMKQTPPPTVAPPLQLRPALHCIQGTLRRPEFQHNGELGSRFVSSGELGSRFTELQTSGGDEDDRLSVMSCRSAASCSAASVVLERAQKRRESFWGKR